MEDLTELQNKDEQENDLDRFVWHKGDVQIYDSLEDMLRDQARHGATEFIEPGKKPKKIK